MFLKSKIEFSDKFKEIFKSLLEDKDFLYNELFRVPAVRDALTLDRYQNLFQSRITKSDSSQSSKVTVNHNSDFQRMFFSELSKRPDLISNVLSSINSVRQNSSRMKVLSIGARTEAEIFSLVNAGFNLKNIECIDLFSYTPYIKVGDVHQLNYENHSFDIVVCGWVLEFCSDINQACSEIRRVAKKNGYICIGGMHHPISTNLEEYNKRKQHEDRVWYCNIESIKKAFNVEDKNWVFKSEIETQDLDKRGEVIAIFKCGEPNV